MSWLSAPVLQVQRETARASRLVLDPPGWPGHQPGQHLDVRLTAPDGYTAQRSYSIASAPEAPYVELLVDRLPDGEVSPYLTEELRP
ncbi:MAG TPA: FAD-binding oxidoreductase, partial [Propionibacteriaceae bacterium]|nr:FAD-binding oxidoreductase [Propionibacteriaceae bacterium]